MSSEIRVITLPEKDRPLREDVSLLGSLVGDMLVDQHGQVLLDLVESVRTASIRNREGNEEQPGGLDSALRGLEEPDLSRLIHAFSTYLRAVNLAEKVHRIRRRRHYQRAETGPQPGSLDAVFETLSSSGISTDALAREISDLRIHPVFTAHPTEATRRTILEKEYDIVLRLVERMNPEFTPAEERLAMRRIRAAITSAWQTRLEPHSRTTVADELDNLLFYLTEILYRVTPGFYDALMDACRHHCETLPGALAGTTILRFGSWVGGDMDGNPNVTAETFLDTLAQQRGAIIGRYLPEVRRLSRYLSQSLSEISVSAAVITQLEDYANLMPEIHQGLPERYLDMPYRCLLIFVAARLAATLKGSEHAYSGAQAFIADIALISQSLAENKGAHAGQFGVDRLLCRVRTFGFHLATLDLRQDALLHRRVLGELLGIDEWEARDPDDRAAFLAKRLEDNDWPLLSDRADRSAEANEVIRVFQSITRARREFGPEAVGMFIISMAQGADDVLTVLALNRLANPDNDGDQRLEVTPLLETVGDLQAGPGILRALLGFSIYREHLSALGNRQTIMIGYSDSSKDSGIVASRWALYEAQRDLVRTGKELGVEITFFHGRGGTVSRGGGNLVDGILGAPSNTVNHHLRMTEQGEVINQKYGVRFIALRNLELVTGATLKHSVDRGAEGLDDKQSEIITFMAGISRQTFRGMVYEDPGFPAYFRAATPLDVIERLNIGSRPASRRSGEGVENLRAIPWVFSWAQTRLAFPGFFGFGTAMQAAIEKFGMSACRDLLDKQIFFRAMINDVEMVLAKSEPGLGRRYSKLAKPDQQHYFNAIAAEYDRATDSILALKQIDSLLDGQRVLQRNIRLRNPYVDPLHLMQIDLLQRWRDGDRQDDTLLEALKATVKGIALGIQNTG